MIKNNFVVLIFCVFLILVSCTDRTSHQTYSYISNATAHTLTLNFFKGHTENKDFLLIIYPGEKKEVYRDIDNGKGKGYPYYSNIYAIDSIIVNVDDTSKVVHYGYNINGINPDAIIYFSNRNIFNKDSWNEKVLVDKKRKTETEFTYTFTNEDFQKAK